MRGTELLGKMELVNAAFVQAADQPPARKRRGRIRWLAVAACFCFVAVAALALWRGSTPAQHAGAARPGTGEAAHPRSGPRRHGL